MHQMFRVLVFGGREGGVKHGRVKEAVVPWYKARF
jgi:hypothetical protein